MVIYYRDNRKLIKQGRDDLPWLCGEGSLMLYLYKTVVIYYYIYFSIIYLFIYLFLIY